MDIVEQVKALNSRIISLEEVNQKQKQELEVWKQKYLTDSEEWRQKLQSEMEEHDFTKMAYEEEGKNLEFSVKLLRQLQATSDSNQLRSLLMDREILIQKLTNELESERSEHRRLNGQLKEAEENSLRQTSTRQSLQAMINVLAAQLRQTAQQLKAQEIIISEYKQEHNRQILNLEGQIIISANPSSSNESNSIQPELNSSVQAVGDHFSAVTEAITKLEGTQISFETAGSLKSLLRASYQSIAEHAIFQAMQTKSHLLLANSAQQQLANERQFSSKLLAILGCLQDQLSTISAEDPRYDVFYLSFLTAQPANSSLM